MEFSEFVRWKTRVLRERPGVTDRSETRIASAFADLRPAVRPPTPGNRVHRCDLARTWCDARGLPEPLATRALVCQGVRHALRLIFQCLTAIGARVAVPRDVYPVYWQIAAEAGAQPMAFDTLPDFDLEAVLTDCAAEGVKIVLVPSPLKLHGRSWTASEAGMACIWLAQDPARRLILDGVYALGRPVDATTLALIGTDQVLYLDSLSKGWLAEKIFGAAIVPAPDRGLYEAAFRASPPPSEHLFLAHELLTAHRAFPATLEGVMRHHRHELVRLLQKSALPSRATPGGYLVLIEASATEVLDGHGVLTIPASAFGSAHAALSIASALPLR